MGMGSRLFLLPLLGVALSACTSASSNYLGEIARVDAARIYVCHGFDCRNTTRLDMSAADRAALTRIMNAGRAAPHRGTGSHLEGRAIFRGALYRSDRRS
jgi:hypothetical protein